MTFPVVQATNTSVEATAVSAHDVSLPASISAGQLLLAILGNADVFTSMAAEAGWTEELDTTSLAIESRIADGGEGATVQFDSAASTTSGHNSYRISGAHGDVEVAAQFSVNNPPSLTPSWGSADTLWIAGVVTSDLLGSVDVTAAPASYSGLIKTDEVTHGLGGKFRVATAWRQLAAASENPGAFTVTDSGAPSPVMAFTIAVRAAAGRGVVGRGLTRSVLLAPRRLVQ